MFDQAACEQYDLTARKKLHDKSWHKFCNDLQNQLGEIDVKGVYPQQYIKELAQFGGYNLVNDDNQPDLSNVIALQSDVSRICLNTGFCAWCHTACGWYLFNSDNDDLKSRFLTKNRDATILSGTGFSNPMKSLAGIDTIKLTAKRTKGGFYVNGVLPWISNIRLGHYFGAVMRLPDGTLIVGFIDTNRPGITIKEQDDFIALNGSATVAVRLQNYFLTDSMLLAEDGLAFLEKIRPGFMLLQMAMGIGHVTACLEGVVDKCSVKKHLLPLLSAEVNDIRTKISNIKSSLQQFVGDPYARTKKRFDKVLQLRLDMSLLCLKAGQIFMLAAGASGYQQNSTAFRKLREAYFVAIVTPSLTQLQKMLNH